jgi:uncharacterized Fe-S cluster protein YjdI/CDGSH-type Zn-finger protein
MGAKDYRNADIVVHWDAVRCIHTGICTRGLPEVFDVSRRPWITVDAADADRIAEVVERCPTGALRYSRLDDRPAEAAGDVLTVTPIRNGPLYVRGPVRVTAPDGSVIAEETRVALCRCGATANPPFCDNSHRAVGFQAPAGPPTATHSAALSPQEICEQQEF